MSNEARLKKEGYRILHAVKQGPSKEIKSSQADFETCISKYYRQVQAYHDQNLLIETYSAPLAYVKSAKNSYQSKRQLIKREYDYVGGDRNYLKFQVSLEQPLRDTRLLELEREYPPCHQNIHENFIRHTFDGLYFDNYQTLTNKREYDEYIIRYSNLYSPYSVFIANSEPRKKISLTKILSLFTTRKSQTAISVTPKQLPQKIYIQHFMPNSQYIVRDLQRIIRNAPISRHADISLGRSPNFINKSAFSYDRKIKNITFPQITSIRIEKVYDTNQTISSEMTTALNNPLAGYVSYEKDDYYIIPGKAEYYARKHDGGGIMLSAYMDKDSRLLERFIPRQIFTAICQVTFEDSKKNRFQGLVQIQLALNVMQF